MCAFAALNNTDSSTVGAPSMIGMPAMSAGRPLETCAATSAPEQSSGRRGSERRSRRSSCALRRPGAGDRARGDLRFAQSLCVPHRPRPAGYCAALAKHLVGLPANRIVKGVRLQIGGRIDELFRTLLANPDINRFETKYTTVFSCQRWGREAEANLGRLRQS